jgi:23S rRNA (cytidine1920-2'-O)/16S rRNA (cytidine1409-2'-O)-methyltransferase
VAGKNCQFFAGKKGITDIKKINRKKIIEILLEKNIVSGEKEALALIMAGKVRAEGKTVEKPGAVIDPDSEIEITPGKIYVSRGGLKLEGAFKDFNLSAEGKKAADIGSSTGGFTDFLLKNGAASVIDIDVGYGQLSWELRKSPRTIIFERTNLRNLDTEKLPYKADITVVDVSFISIKNIFNKILEITDAGGKILILVKPQFELKKNEVENKGIIKDRKLHYRVLDEITGFIKNFPAEIKGFNFSKIKGAKGNIEFWIFLIKSHKEAESIKKYDKIIRDVIDKAHFYYNQS